MAGSSVADRLNKLLGDVHITQFGDDVPSYPTLSTGNMEIDAVLGGGIPKGKITELAGKEGGGKTSLANQIVARTQQEGGICAFVDVEYAFNAEYAVAQGVDVSSLLFAQPDNMEDALRVVEAICQDGEVDLVVVDSIGAMASQRELDGELTDANVGVRARILGNALRRIAPLAARNDVTVLFLNQLRANVGAMGAASPTMTPGGHAFKHSASLMMTVTRTGHLKQGDDVIGQTVKVTTSKNKAAAPYKTAIVDFIYGEGYSNEASLLKRAIADGILVKSGAWIKWADSGESFAQGAERARKMLVDDPQLYDDLRQRVDNLTNEVV